MKRRFGIFRRPDEEERAGGMSLADYAALYERFSFNGIGYTIPSGKLEELTALQAMSNPIVGAVIAVRMLVFSEIRFALQKMQALRGMELRDSPALNILQQPWPQANTGDLLATMELDASFYGNSYWTYSTQFDQLVRLDPCRIQIATADIGDITSGNPYSKRLVGYQVTDDNGKVIATFLPEEVGHYKPLTDPNCVFRGRTWLSSLMPDIQADNGLTDYKGAFLKNAATPNLIMSMKDGVSKENFDQFKDKMEARHSGASSGFKTLYLSAGVDVKAVGSNFADLAMNAVQSAGETRIAAAGGVPPGLVGLSEALKGSTLNAGNYAATRRRFSDGTMRPLWRSAAGALSTLVTVPRGSRLWYEDRDVAFLQEDVTDTAAIKKTDADTVLTFIQAGFTPESAIQAVTTGDFTVLEHTGLVSVQLQKPGPALAPGGAEQSDPRIPGTPAAPEPDPIPDPAVPQTNGSVP